MKKIISISVFFFLIVSLFTVNAVKPQKKTVAAVSNVAKVEVYYFHFTRRCITCQAVEAETQKAIAALYNTQYKSGIITFKSVNLDEDDGKILAEKCKSEGQALLVISASKRIDLTDQGFMYAKNNPDKFKLELKNTIDQLIK